MSSLDRLRTEYRTLFKYTVAFPEFHHFMPPTTIGMMLVACLAARAGDLLITTMTVFSRIQRSTVLGVTRQRSASSFWNNPSTALQHVQLVTQS